MKRILILIGLLALAPGLHAKEGAVQCANLIYNGGTQTSRCFSDQFLSAVQRETAIPTERRFKSVKLGSEELFDYPFVVATGESDFHFTTAERENLKKYLSSGGFLLASAGCSNQQWQQAFAREMRTMFPDNEMTAIPPEHPLYRTVYTIEGLKLKSPDPDAKLMGLEMDGKIVCIFSPHGLNNTANTDGCCCCGGNEILNSLQVNVNIFVYALLH